MIRDALVLAATAGALASAGCESGTASSGAAAGSGVKPVDSAARTQARRAAVVADTGWAERCPIPTVSPPAPIGRTAAALIANYGPAAEDERFVLGDAIDPVRMSVRNTLSAPGDLKRDIRELTWRTRGCELTVWRAEQDGEEVALQTMRGPAAGEP